MERKGERLHSSIKCNKVKQILFNYAIGISLSLILILSLFLCNLALPLWPFWQLQLQLQRRYPIYWPYLLHTSLHLCHFIHLQMSLRAKNMLIYETTKL